MVATLLEPALAGAIRLVTAVSETEPGFSDHPLPEHSLGSTSLRLRSNPSSESRISQFDLGALADAKPGSTVAPEYMSKGVYWVEKENGFAGLWDRTIIGVQYDQPKHLMFEDMLNGYSAPTPIGRHQSRIQTVLLSADERTILAGDASGRLVQYEQRESIWSVARDYGNLDIGALTASAQHKHFAVLGGNDRRLAVVDTARAELLSTTEWSAVKLVLSLAVCALRNRKVVLAVCGSGLDYAWRYSDLLEWGRAWNGQNEDSMFSLMSREASEAGHATTNASRKTADQSDDERCSIDSQNQDESDPDSVENIRINFESKKAQKVTPATSPTDAEVSAQISRLQSVIDQQAQQLADARKRCESQDQTITKLRRSKAGLKSKITERSSQNKALRKQIRVLKRSAKASQNQLVNARRKFQLVRAKLGWLSSQRASAGIDSACDSSHSEDESDGEELSPGHVLRGATENLHGKNSRDSEQLRLKCDELRDRNDQLRDDCVSYRDDRDRLADQNQGMRVRLEKIRQYSEQLLDETVKKDCKKLRKEAVQQVRHKLKKIRRQARDAQ